MITKRRVRFRPAGRFLITVVRALCFGMLPPIGGWTGPRLRVRQADGVGIHGAGAAKSGYDGGLEQPNMTQDPADPPRPLVPCDSTQALLVRARSGDRLALEVLFERCLPPLRRFARAKLNREARELSDSQDLVQDTLAQVFGKLGTFECQGEGALMAYLRTAVVNRVHDLNRKLSRRPLRAVLDDRLRDPQSSPLEVAIGREDHEAYERALANLKPSYRQAIVMRYDLQFDFERIAEALGKGNAGNARMFVKRATVKLAREIAALRQGRARKFRASWTTLKKKYA